jgi:hypothetical protein
MGFEAGSEPLIVRPGEGPRSGGTSGTGRVKVDLADSRSFAILESAPPAGVLGPPRHIHEEFDEAWYVLEGEMEFSIGDQVELCGSGSLAFYVTELTTSGSSCLPARALFWGHPAKLSGAPGHR